MSNYKNFIYIYKLEKKNIYKNMKIKYLNLFKLVKFDVIIKFYLFNTLSGHAYLQGCSAGALTDISAKI